MSLAEEVYALTRHFPREETFGLTSQLRRACAGIPSHVAEGHQHSTRAYLRYVVIALGSQAECETQLELAVRLGLSSPEATAPARELAARVGQVLHGLARSLARKTKRERMER